MGWRGEGTVNANPNAIRIVCFGDSLTWGYMPATGHSRFPADKRWTGLLQEKLGDGFEIIEEGLNSRSLVSDDLRPGKEGRNGSQYLIPCLDTHDPIDLFILFLGTNELKDSYATSAEEIGRVLEEKFVKIILERRSQYRETFPKLLIIAPPPLDLTKEYAYARYANSAEKSAKLPSVYESIADTNGAIFLASSEFVETGEDGVHITEQSHAVLADAIYDKVISLYE